MTSHTLRSVGLKAIGGTLLVGSLAGAVIYADGRTDRELRGLPETDRRPLYQRTLDTLRTSCAHARGPNLSDFCTEQAAFVSRFPECDADCRELARKFASHPTHWLR